MSAYEPISVLVKLCVGCGFLGSLPGPDSILNPKPIVVTAKESQKESLENVCQNANERHARRCHS